MANKSVEQFKRLTEDLQREVHAAAVQELNAQAQSLAQTIQSVAPKKEGRLQHSVRVIPGKNDTQVRIVAGGQETIRPEISSKPYDYARADEFGTVKMPAKPFFFPTYRLQKKKIVSTMKRRITAAIKARSAE